MDVECLRVSESPADAEGVSIASVQTQGLGVDVRAGCTSPQASSRVLPRGGTGFRSTSELSSEIFECQRTTDGGRM